ncbi:MAG: hypothetical protein SGPRY_014175 [Prymnesium sp.]
MVRSFVNFKLYHDLSLSYPPSVDPAADASGSFLSAMLLKPATPALPSLPPPKLEEGEVLSQSEAAKLKKKIAQIDEAEEKGREGEGEEEGVGGADEEEARLLQEVRQEGSLTIC